MLNFERDPHQSGAKVKAIQQTEYGSCCGMATKNCRMWIWQTLFLGPIHILQDTACCLPFLWHEPIFNSHNYYYAGRLIENCAPNVCRLQYDHEKTIVDHFAVANVCDHLFGQWIDRDNRQVIFFLLSTCIDIFFLVNYTVGLFTQKPHGRMYLHMSPIVLIHLKHGIMKTITIQKNIMYLGAHLRTNCQHYISYAFVLFGAVANGLLLLFFSFICVCYMVSTGTNLE